MAKCNEAYIVTQLDQLDLMGMGVLGQICKVAGRTRAGNAGNVFPAADFRGNY